jgi:hypothetical protein
MKKICKYCKTEFQGRRSSVYCSRACRNKDNPIKYTKERKKKHSVACKGINKGKNNPMYGKSGELSPTFGTKRTLECRKRLSELKKGKYLAENNPNWQGGISNNPYPLDWNNVLKDSIRLRDNFICQECGIHQDELDRKLDIHHIDYDKNNLNPKNLISLCRKCHIKTNFNREEWIEYFMGVKNE